MTSTFNTRIVGYLLVALGLLNWRYQSAQPNVATHSLVIIVYGVILLALSLSDQGMRFLGSRVGRIGSSIIAVGLVIFAIFN